MLMNIIEFLGMYYNIFMFLIKINIQDQTNEALQKKQFKEVKDIFLNFEFN